MVVHALIASHISTGIVIALLVGSLVLFGEFKDNPNICYSSLIQLGTKLKN